MSDVYQFDRFVLDPKKRTLLWDRSPVHLTPKAFDILLLLLRNPNRVVTKDELMKAVWPDTFVEEGNLTFNISVLRRTLAQYSPDERLIVTLARQGYQFTPDVAVAHSAETPARAADTPESAEKGAGQGFANGVEPGTDAPTAPLPAGQPSPLQIRRRGWIIVALLTPIILVASYLGWRGSRRSLPTGSTTRLAVLPCLNLTGDPNEEYLADGITEELISRLAQLNPQKLSVIARTSVMGYKQPGRPLEEISRDLGVQRVLESSVRGSAGRLRITVQLIDVGNQSHLWSSDYDYQSRDILGLEEDVAQAVAQQIQLGFASRRPADSGRSHAISSDAIDAYLQGQYFFQHPTKDNFNKAVAYFEQAIKLDSTYALAWVALSHTQRRQVEYGFIPQEEGYRQARENAERALALDDGLGIAHANLGWIQINHDWDWEGANASVQRALQLDPGNAGILGEASALSTSLGRYDEALTEAQRTVELDPLNPYVHAWLGQLLLGLNRPQEAAVSLQRAMQLRHDYPLVHGELALVYLAEGRAQDALVESEQEPIPSWRLRDEALANYRLGRRHESDSILAELTAQHQDHAAYQIAEAYASRGEADEAFRWLERAYTQRDPGLSATKADPLLVNLRGDPRFNAFLAKLHLPR